MADKREGNASLDRDRIVPGSRDPGRDVNAGRRNSSRASEAGRQEGANIHGSPDSNGRHGGNR